MYSLLPGTVIFVYIGIIRHVGIVTDRYENGKPMVISNSLRKMGVYEESWDDFACGKEVHVLEYSSPLNPDFILSKARSMLGSKWNPLKWNCEHFVTWSLNNKPHSPQLRLVAICAAVGIGISVFGKYLKPNRV